ncbi:MAG TPA: hypothetical protein VM889_00065, partial [Candidatus Thermoplasmatota archaeon]|nr:hypothetical protein [Candidatus Thermoplasmatota archaeon]
MTDGPLSGARGAALVASAAVAEVATQIATGHVILAVGAFALVLGLGIAPWGREGFRFRRSPAENAPSEGPSAQGGPLPVQAYRPALRRPLPSDATPERALADLERAMNHLRRNVAHAIDDLGTATERDALAMSEVAGRLAADVREIHAAMADVVARVDETDARDRVKALEVQFESLATEFAGFIQATAEAAEQDETIAMRLDRAADATERFETRLEAAKEAYARALATLGERLDASLATLSEEIARESRRADVRERDVEEGFERVQATARRLEHEVEETGDRVETALASTARRLEREVGETGERVESALESTARRLGREVGETGERVESALEATARRLEREVKDTVGRVESALEATARRLEREVEERGQRLETAVDLTERRLEANSRAASEDARRALDAVSTRLAEDLAVIRSTLREVDSRIAEASTRATATDAASIDRLARIEDATATLGRRLDDVAAAFATDLSKGLGEGADRILSALAAARGDVADLERAAEYADERVLERVGEARSESVAAKAAAGAALEATREASHRIEALESRLSDALAEARAAQQASTAEARAAANAALLKLESIDRETTAALTDLRQAVSTITQGLERAASEGARRSAAASEALATRLDAGRAALAALEERLEARERASEARARAFEDAIARSARDGGEALGRAIASASLALEAETRSVGRTLESLASRIADEAAGAQERARGLENALAEAIEQDRASSMALADALAALARRFDETAKRDADRFDDLLATLGSRLEAAEARLVAGAEAAESRASAREAEGRAHLDKTVASLGRHLDAAFGELGARNSDAEARMDAGLERLARELGQNLASIEAAVRADRARFEGALAELGRTVERAVEGLGAEGRDGGRRIEENLAALAGRADALRADVARLGERDPAMREALSGLEGRLAEALRDLGRTFDARSREGADAALAALADLGRRSDVLATSQARLAEEAARIHATQAGLAAEAAHRHDAVIQAARDLSGDLAEIRDALGRDAREHRDTVVAALERGDLAVLSRFDDLEAATSALSARLAELERSSAEEARALEAALGDEHASVVGAVSEARDDLARDLATIHQTLEATLGETRGLDALIEEAASGLDATIVSRLEAQAALVASARDDLASRLASMAATLSATESAVASAMERHGALAADRGRALEGPLAEAAERLAKLVASVDDGFGAVRASLLDEARASATREARLEAALDARVSTLKAAIDDLGRDALAAVAALPAPATPNDLAEVMEAASRRLEDRLASVDDHVAALAGREPPSASAIAQEAASRLAASAQAAADAAAARLVERLDGFEARVAADLGHLTATSLDLARSAPDVEAIADALRPVLDDATSRSRAATEAISRDLAYLAAADDRLANRLDSLATGATERDGRLAERIESLAKSAAERGDALLTRLGALEERLAVAPGLERGLEALANDTRSLHSGLTGEVRAVRDDLARIAAANGAREREALEGLTEASNALEVRFDAFRREAERRDALVEGRLKDAAEAARATAERLASHEAVQAARLADHTAAIARAIESQAAQTRSAMASESADALDEIHERLGGLESNLETKLALGADTSRQVADHVARLEGRLDGLGLRLESGSETVQKLATTVAEGFASARERADRLAGALDALVARMEELDRSVAAAARGDAAARAELAGAQTRLAADVRLIDERVEALARDMEGAILARLDDDALEARELARDVAALGARFDALEAALGRRLEARDDSMEKRLERVEDAARRAEGRVAESEAALLRRLDEVARAVDRLAVDATQTAESTRSRVVGEVEAINRELRSLEARVVDRPVARAATDPVDHRVADLNARVERALGKLEGLSERNAGAPPAAAPARTVSTPSPPPSSAAGARPTAPRPPPRLA